MKKLIILLLIFAAASATVPELRQRVEPRVVPVWDSALRRLEPVLLWALAPVHRWAARNEAQSIARMLGSRYAASRRLPQANEFAAYLKREWRGGRNGLDPWGTPYYLVVTVDSITVASAGRDMERGTDDDIRASVERR
ncbi:MAG TPA: hypothetical protein VF212_10240 [Longimicrobiales bacterium]